jgi:hypothetical protein
LGWSADRGYPLGELRAEILYATLVLALGWRAPWSAGRGPAIAAAALAVILYAAWETDNRIVWVAFAVQFLLAASLMRVPVANGVATLALAADFIPHTPRALNHPQIRHGHNIFVDMALQLGAIGLAAFVGLLALLAREYRGYLRRDEVAPLGVLGLLVLSGFLVKCLTDDFLHRHNALAFWALNAMLMGCARATLARAKEATPLAEAAPP